MPPPEKCDAACQKTIIDSRVIGASARHVLRRAKDRFADLEAAAGYLADIADISTAAFERANASTTAPLTKAQLDHAHAFSELCCHRATYLRETSVNDIQPATVMAWADEMRLFTTEQAGGEYKGAWTVDGTKGISLKDAS